MSEFDEILNELGFKIPDLKVPEWAPEDFGFHAKKISDTLVRGDIYYNGVFELRKRDYNYWLLRKKIKNTKGNTEYLTRFYLKIEPEEIEIAKWLLINGLR